MQITGSQWRTLTDALNQFSLSKLDIMLRFELNQDREAIALGDDKTDIVYRVIEHYNFRDQVELLVKAALAYNPTNTQLQLVASDLNQFTMQPIETIVYDESGEPSVNEVKPARLERTVRRLNPPLDPEIWLQQLSLMKHRIGRIEHANQPSKGVGTGFLVAKDVILTNYHVLEEFLSDDGTLPDDHGMQIRFDHAMQPGVAAASEGIVYAIDELIDASAYSPNDKIVGSTNLPDIDQLDYALLFVDGTPGDEPIGGAKPGVPTSAQPETRGWVKVTANKYTFPNDAPLLIYQHPDGGVLKLAIETNAIEKVNENRTRVLYRTNTKSGASGSPCFDMDLNLVALHHGSTWGDAGVVNRGIPIDTIYALLDARGFLGDLG